MLSLLFDEQTKASGEFACPTVATLVHWVIAVVNKHTIFSVGPMFVNIKIKKSDFLYLYHCVDFADRG